MLCKWPRGHRGKVFAAVCHYPRAGMRRGRGRACAGARAGACATGGYPIHLVVKHVLHVATTRWFSPSVLQTCVIVSNITPVMRPSPGTQRPCVADPLWPYHGEYTRTRPISEAKPRWASLVLRWETTAWAVAEGEVAGAANAQVVAPRGDGTGNHAHSCRPNQQAQLKFA